MEFLDAVQKGDLERVRHLLDSKADGNAIGGPEHENVIALHLAAEAEKNSAEMIRLLAVEYKTGGDINARAMLRTRPLHDAIKAGNLEAVELLLSLKADANASRAFGQSPLLIAAANGNLPCVRALLAARADPGHVDCDGLSVLFYAAEASTPDVLQFFIEQNTCDIRGDGKHAVAGYNRDTLLHYAAREGRSRNVKLLLGLGCRVNKLNRRNGLLEMTPIFEAASCKTAPPEELRACVESLLAARADITDKLPGNYNLLHIAATSNNATAVISYLRERIKRSKGAARAAGLAMIEARGGDGHTPLLSAAYYCRAKAARALIEIGADIEARRNPPKVIPPSAL